MVWDKLGLTVGLEVHWELNTKEKLFCDCPTELKNEEPHFILQRFMRPVAGELGDVDVTTKFESGKEKKLIYQGYHDSTCLVEMDCEPPHNPNGEAVKIALTISLLLNAKPVDEVHVMRKTIIDGSNVSGFQRTMLIATNGWVLTSEGKVRINNISLEEDSARIIDNKSSMSVFRLDRLGIPEVEIGTGPDIFSPEQALEVAETIGRILKSTGKIKSGLGVVRQDVNISIKDGARTEIKHVQRLGQIPDVIKKEVERQMLLIKNDTKINEEVRVANIDCTTNFLRPLGTASRMYPESDIYPIKIDKKLLNEIAKHLPESLEKKLERYKKMNLSKDLAEQIIKSEYVNLFEKIISEIKIDASIVANALVNITKDLKRKNMPVENLNDNHFVEIFNLVKENRLTKEGVSLVLEKLSLFPFKSIIEIVKELNLSPISENELENIVKIKIEENKNKLTDKEGAIKFLMGLVMKDTRGKISGELVNKIVRKNVEKIFK
ncbi:MAG: Glu-tRNA(Gln) amidotransferase subunit GatE [Candidatus Aenigmarchaeota archaeon]|nr:Glu-tRNA(Gln) amidotransferase subunit GatE [Candidatus Aenigmarchaeota archaeon]